MPFAALPSSPGFVQPQAPDWTRFAAQANEFIMEGGKMRAAAGRDLADSITQAASQIDSILKEHSPEAKMQKELKREMLKAQLGLYSEYKKMTPEQRAATFEFKNGMLMYRDKYKNIMQGVRLTNAIKQGQLLDKRLSGGSNPTIQYMREQTARGRVTDENLPALPVIDSMSNSGDAGTNTASEDAAALLDLGGVGDTNSDVIDTEDELD